MIEGSRIDHAEHANDAAAMYWEALEFDKTVALAMDYAYHSLDTLVLVTADHGTGGLTLGADGIYAYYPSVILAVQKSSDIIANAIISNPSKTVELFLKYTGLSNITANEAQQLINAQSNFTQLRPLIVQIVSSYALVGWTTSGHTGEDVNLYGYGPAVNNFCGNLDNTDLALKLAKVFNWDVDAITKLLVDFDTSGANFSYDLQDYTFDESRDNYHKHK